MKSLDSSFFIHNREKAIEKLQGGLLVVAGYTGMQRGNDAEFKFEQESNMWYLSGIEYPDWWLIIDGKRSKSWLVEPDIEESHRLFTESLLTESARQISGIQDVISRDQAMAMLRLSAKSHPVVYTVGPPSYHEHFTFTLNPSISDMKAMLSRIFVKVEDFRLELARLRSVKQTIELELMQQAIDLTTETLNDIKTRLSTYKHEYEIEAGLSHAFRVSGGSGHAFDPIVSSGKNATVVHYFTNNSPLKKGTFVMLDVGARVNGYCGDITRTYAYGKPTKRMTAVHDAVRNAQQEIIALLKPGLLVEEYQRNVDNIVKSKMVSLNIISSMNDDVGYHHHMSHAVSHGLGVDVHDALGKAKEFLPGMVITVEPGIYLHDEGIGVRIEDDVLITDTGSKVLSGKLPATY
ncbi:MAG: Xaa-Pro peptidase family protein [Candidatus Saccharimonadales bacterium]